MSGHIWGMQDPYFFGYGSLVNVATHSYAQPHRARARGWRRAWRHTDLRPVSFLTAVPDQDTAIEGLIAAVPGGDWAALDERERAYERVPASQQVDHALQLAEGHVPDIAIYAIAAGNHRPPNEDNPILLSYLLTVLQGYEQQFGFAGVAQFIASTDGWEAPIRDDRAAPVYPRHRPVTSQQQAYYLDLLTDIGARILIPDT